MQILVSCHLSSPLSPLILSPLSGLRSPALSSPLFSMLYRLANFRGAEFQI